jgi:hypothetical protein
MTALGPLSWPVGSATRAGEGVIAPLVTLFVIVSAFVIARGWRRNDRMRPGSSMVAVPAQLCRPDDLRSLMLFMLGPVVKADESAQWPGGRLRYGPVATPAAQCPPAAS